jgi:hypothetical protein
MAAQPTFERFTDYPFTTETRSCENCGNGSAFLGRISTNEGERPLLCTDCAGELRRMEALADALCAQLGCEERERIMDACETTAELVNRLRAHELAQCAACASTRATVATDRLHLNQAAVCCEGAAYGAHMRSTRIVSIWQRAVCVSQVARNLT